MIDTFLQLRLTDTRIQLKFTLFFSYNWHPSSNKIDWYHTLAQIYAFVLDLIYTVLQLPFTDTMI